MRRESLMMTWIGIAHCNDGEKANVFIPRLYTFGRKDTF